MEPINYLKLIFKYFSSDNKLELLKFNSSPEVPSIFSKFFLEISITYNACNKSIKKNVIDFLRNNRQNIN